MDLILEPHFFELAAAEAILVDGSASFVERKDRVLNQYLNPLNRKWGGHVLAISNFVTVNATVFAARAKDATFIAKQREIIAFAVAWTKFYEDAKKFFLASKDPLEAEVFSRAFAPLCDHYTALVMLFKYCGGGLSPEIRRLGELSSKHMAQIVDRNSSQARA